MYVIGNVVKYINTCNIQKYVKYVTKKENIHEMTGTIRNKLYRLGIFISGNNHKMSRYYFYNSK